MLRLSCVLLPAVLLLLLCRAAAAPGNGEKGLRPREMERRSGVGLRGRRGGDGLRHLGELGRRGADGCPKPGSASASRGARAAYGSRFGLGLERWKGPRSAAELRARGGGNDRRRRVDPGWAEPGDSLKEITARQLFFSASFAEKKRRTS